MISPCILSSTRRISLPAERISRSVVSSEFNIVLLIPAQGPAKPRHQPRPISVKIHRRTRIPYSCTLVLTLRSCRKWRRSGNGSCSCGGCPYPARRHNKLFPFRIFALNDSSKQPGVWVRIPNPGAPCGQLAQWMDGEYPIHPSRGALTSHGASPPARRSRDQRTLIHSIVPCPH